MLVDEYFQCFNIFFEFENCLISYPLIRPSSKNFESPQILQFIAKYKVLKDFHFFLSWRIPRAIADKYSKHFVY